MGVLRFEERCVVLVRVWAGNQLSLSFEILGFWTLFPNVWVLPQPEGSPTYVGSNFDLAYSVLLRAWYISTTEKKKKKGKF